MSGFRVVVKVHLKIVFLLHTGILLSIRILYQSLEGDLNTHRQFIHISNIFIIECCCHWPINRWWSESITIMSTSDVTQSPTCCPLPWGRSYISHNLPQQNIYTKKNKHVLIVWCSRRVVRSETRGHLWNQSDLVGERQEMEVSGRMCVSHALRPLSLGAIWMPELAQYLHCHRLPEKPHEREREREK